MGLFEHWPYVNFHELNLDWIIKEIPKVFTARDEAQASAEASAESAAASQLSANAALASQEAAHQSELNAAHSEENAAQSEQDASDLVEGTRNQINLLQSRVDNIIPDGTQTEGNTELLDIRVGYGGQRYESAGNAVRKQIEEVADAAVSYVAADYLTRASDDPGSAWRYINGAYSKATGPGTAYWHIEEYGAEELTHYTVTGTSESPSTPVVCFADDSYNILGSSTVPASGSRTTETVNVITPIGTTKLLVNMFLLDKSTAAVKRISENSLAEEVNNLNDSLDYFYKTGNELIPVEYDQGDLSLTTGEGTYSLIAIRSKDFYGPGQYTLFTHGQLVYVFKYLTDGTPSGSFVWGQSGTVSLSVPDTNKFKIVVNKADHSTINPSENLVELTENTFIYDFKKSIPVRTAGFISVCHQGYSLTDTLGRDRLSGYPLAAKMGFEYAECDIKLTSDRQLVCCHDDSFVDATTSETVVIADHTLAELQTYDYYGETIATLEQVLEACKTNGIGLCIDHISTANVDLIVPKVKKYGMQRNVYYIISYMEAYPNLAGIMFDYIANLDPLAKYFIIPVGNDPNTLTVDFCNRNITNFNEIVMDMNYATNDINSFITVREGLDVRCKIGMWTNDNLASCKMYLPYVNAISSNKISSAQLFLE